MKLTEKEIHGQYAALAKTLTEVESQTNQIKEFFAKQPHKSIAFIGCGSSLSIAKSLAVTGNMLLDVPAFAIAAGDLWLNFSKYEKQLTDCILVGISRSGSTSELLYAFVAAKDVAAGRMAIICAENAPIRECSDFNIVLPWAFDHSVCQTSCVTNMYSAGMALIAILSGDNKIVASLKKAAQIGDAFMAKYHDPLKQLANQAWDNVVVLADAELEGLAEEAALAFKEISQLQSNYYHILDSRHGPMVLIGPKTAVIIMATHQDNPHEKALIADVVKKGATVIVCSQQPMDIEGIALNAWIGEEMHHAAAGAMYISLCQLLSYHKSFVVGCDPDAPQGLNPWIKI